MILELSIHKFITLFSGKRVNELQQTQGSWLHCVVPENIYNPTTEGHWKFHGGGGFSKDKIFKAKSIDLDWNFQGVGVKPKKNLHTRSMVFFFGTTHCHKIRARVVDRRADTLEKNDYVVCRR